MLRFSLSKELFQDILIRKERVLTREISSYWKSELLDVKIVNNKIKYDIKQISELSISNGFGEEKPSLKVECEHIQYNGKSNQFEFRLGRILEQKNVDISENYKDSLIDQLLREKEVLEDRMNRDHLTNVYNRRKMEEDLKRFTNQNNANELSAVFVDADRFKGINDNFGHDIGDRALQYVSKKMQKHAYFMNGEVYRYGGEEFIILCFLPKDELLVSLDNLREDIKSEKILHPFRDIALTVSMGVSFWYKSNSIEHLIKVADEGVYKAKNNGRDRIEIG